MIVTFVHIWVKKDRINDFIEASIKNHSQSVKETGNLRFDILKDANDPEKFTFYEAYTSEEAAAMHKNTDHYKIWRDAVADWMTKPREGVKNFILYPIDKKEW